MQNRGLSHITLAVSALERSTLLVERLLGGRKIYDSGERTFSIAKERFFFVGDLWLCLIECAEEPLPRSYNHIAFQAASHELKDCLSILEELGLCALPGRSRVEGEGASIYFYDWDHHLFELHSGTLEERLRRYNQSDK